MKNICLIILALLSVKVSKAQQTAYLDLGSKVVDYPKVDWLKGKPITHFDKDKIYVVELWATWCGPCVAAMPHLNELNLKFKDKNVVFIAQDIMEDDQEKVEVFVKQKGDDLSCTVAFSGTSGSDFDKKWVKVAGVTSIPQTFIIQNDILVWQTYPWNLNDKILQLLVDGKFSIDTAEAMIHKE